MGVAYNSRIVTENLVLCLDAANTKSYPGSGTTWTDLSGRGYSTTINTTYVVYNSSNGGHLTFSGNGTTAQGGNIVGAAPILSSANTVEFAVYTPSTYYQILTNNYYGYGEGDWVFSKNGSTNIVLGSTLNSWNMFSVTFNGTNTVTGYKNGVLGNTSSSFDFSGLTGDLPIGARPWSPYVQNFKLGYIRIYNRALSAAEISQNYNALRGRFGSDDPGNGQGYSIAQSASSTNGVYTSASPTNYISSWYLSAGGNGTPLNYTCSGSSANFAYHTGHNGNSSQWPMYHAIQVSTNTYGQVINRINWYKHSNACGNVDIWGTTRAITSQNYTDTSLYTYLGRVNMGGYGSAGDCNVSSGTFNSSSYGYNWILLQVQDISGALSYPSVGTLGGWAMYGMQLVKQ